jgi:hypothetical protein
MKPKAPIVESIITEDSDQTNEPEAMKLIVKNYFEKLYYD